MRFFKKFPKRIAEEVELTIHPGRHEVHVKGKPVQLTGTEFTILHLLAGRPG